MLMDSPSSNPIQQPKHYFVMITTQQELQKIINLNLQKYQFGQLSDDGAEKLFIFFNYLTGDFFVANEDIKKADEELGILELIRQLNGKQISIGGSIIQNIENPMVISAMKEGVVKYYKAQFKRFMPKGFLARKLFVKFYQDETKLDFDATNKMIGQRMELLNSIKTMSKVSDIKKMQQVGVISLFLIEAFKSERIFKSSRKKSVGRVKEYASIFDIIRGFGFDISISDGEADNNSTRYRHIVKYIKFAERIMS